MPVEPLRTYFWRRRIAERYLPQQRFIELLAGKPSPADASVHAAIVERMSSLFALQRLVSLKTLFDLADHLERVSRGEAFNVAMANRLPVRFPRCVCPAPTFPPSSRTPLPVAAGLTSTSTSNDY